MKNLFFLIGLLLITNLTAYAGDWQVIKTSQTARIIREKDGQIFYTSKSEFHLVSSNGDSLLHDFSPLVIAGLYITDSSAIIAANDWQALHSKLLYRYIFKTGQLREFVTPTGDYVDGIIEWRQKPLVIVHHNTGQYLADTYFIQITNSADALDTLFAFGGNFQFLSMTDSSDEKIIVNGYIPSPVLSVMQHFTCLWNAQKNKFDLLNRSTDYSNITFSLNDPGVFLTDDYGPNERIKSIHYGGYYSSYYLALYLDWRDSSKLVKGTDFKPIGALRIDNSIVWDRKILLVGRVALDKDGNLTSVRIYSVTGGFIDEGRGLESIYCLYYNKPAEGVYNVFLGSNNKIYNKKYLFATTPVNTKTKNYGYNDLHYKLNQNYPNPFNPSALISYSLDKAAYVKLRVFDILGKMVKILVNEIKPEGYHTVRFDGSNLPSGLYLCELQCDNHYVAVEKMLLLK